MGMKRALTRVMVVTITLAMVVPYQVFSATGEEGASAFKQAELDQLLAPVALYPDELLSQVFMASTYPLEVVQADRWAKKNDKLAGETLTNALDQQDWDPSVKSLVNFPEVLTMMSSELEWTQKLGDAFLAQQGDVLDTVQGLRDKAHVEGNLETNKEQKVVVEKETKTIIIEPADPQIIYVPRYDPVVVYGSWWYPSYPPYTYYPPGYTAGAALLSFGAGVAVGAAWGWAWGGCNWGRHRVDIDINRNVNVNNRVNRDKYRNQMAKRGQLDSSGKGRWQHDPTHRKGAAYRDRKTAQKYNRGASADAVKSREAFRGRARQDRQKLGQSGSRKAAAGQAGKKVGAAGKSTGRTGTSGKRTGKQSNRINRTQQSRNLKQGGGAFQGVDRGRSVKNFSERGANSRKGRSKRGGGARSGGSRRGGGRK